MSPTTIKSGLLRVVLFLLVSCPRSGLIAQVKESCAEKLREAQTLFEKGQTRQVEGMLAGCLRSGFKKEEELAAYKLIIQTHVLNDQPAKADSAMLSFLRKNPEYKPSQTDHSSFIYLYNTFNVDPVIQFSVRAGLNVPFMTFVSDNSVLGEKPVIKYGSGALNLHISAEARIIVGKNLEAGAELAFSQLSFSSDYTTTFASGKYHEVQSRIELPVFVMYNLADWKKFTPFVRLGAGPSLDIASKGDFSLEMTDLNNPNDRPPVSLNRGDSRRRIDLVIQPGGGMKYKIPGGYIFAEARFSLGLLNQNIPGGESTQNQNHLYFWADPDFRLNCFSVSVGYTYIIYRPTKKAGAK
ncbi:MAG: outer membrane beta-barrel protein [Bacteroidales bacterium]